MEKLSYSFFSKIVPCPYALQFTTDKSVYSSTGVIVKRNFLLNNNVASQNAAHLYLHRDVRFTLNC